MFFFGPFLLLFASHKKLSYMLSIRVKCLALYINSPPRRSPGKYELSELGVARCWSLLSSPALLHNELLDGGAPHNWLELPPQVSGGCAVLFVGRRPQPLLPEALVCCWPPWLNCCNKVWTSLSPGDSANIVVLPRTQLFNAPWAWNNLQLLLFFLNKNGKKSLSQ